MTLGKLPSLPEPVSPLERGVANNASFPGVGCGVMSVMGKGVANDRMLFVRVALSLGTPFLPYSTQHTTPFPVFASALPLPGMPLPLCLWGNSQPVFKTQFKMVSFS